MGETTPTEFDRHCIDLHAASVVVRFKDGDVQARIEEFLPATELNLDRAASGQTVAELV